MVGGGVVYGDGDVMNRAQKSKTFFDDQLLDPMFASVPSNSSLGSRTMLSFGNIGGVNKSGITFLQSLNQEESVSECFDEYFTQPEKKRRLSVEQVQFLETSFEAENKLEPERRCQLAKELGMQPRQVAIWFQNRRARWKTKQLETDYETLHERLKKLKSDYDDLLKENEKLKAEVLCLKNNGELVRYIDKTNLQFYDATELSEEMTKETIADMTSEDEESNEAEHDSKKEQQSSVKTDISNVESPQLADGIHSYFLRSGDSFGINESYPSDFSQYGEAASSFYSGFPVEDHAFSFWSY